LKAKSPEQKMKGFKKQKANS